MKLRQINAQQIKIVEIWTFQNRPPELVKSNLLIFFIFELQYI